MIPSCGSRDIYFYTLVNPHIKLQIFCENLFMVHGKSQSFGVFPDKYVRFVSICTQNGEFPDFFGNIAQNVLSFRSILHIKCLNCVIFEENPKYLESSYHLTVYLAFCLANIPIFSESSPTKYRL